MTKKNQLIFKIDYLSLVGDYVIDGKILILPIKGSGQSNITMGNNLGTLNENMTF